MTNGVWKDAHHTGKYHPEGNETENDAGQHREVSRQKEHRGDQ
jgi:hypothetical protein